MWPRHRASLAARAPVVAIAAVVVRVAGAPPVAVAPLGGKMLRLSPLYGRVAQLLKLKPMQGSGKSVNVCFVAFESVVHAFTH